MVFQILALQGRLPHDSWPLLRVCLDYALQSITLSTSLLRRHVRQVDQRSLSAMEDRVQGTIDNSRGSYHITLVR